MPLKVVGKLKPAPILGLLTIVGLLAAACATPAPTEPAAITTPVPLSGETASERDAQESAPSTPPPSRMGAISPGQHIRFERIPIEQAAVTSILQDSKGFLWLGTADGLSKYDGYSFTVYKNDPDDPRTLSDNFVWSIREDRAGRLWIGTGGGGLNRFDPQTEQFTRYQHDPDDPYSLSHDMVQSVYEDRSGRLWIGTSGGGLNRFDPQTERFTRYQHDLDDPHSLSDDTVFSICEDHTGLLWVGTYGGGLNKFDPQTEQFTRYRHDSDDPHSLSHDIVWSIHEDRAGLLWIGTNGGGLDRFDPQTEQFTHYQHDPDAPHTLSGNLVQPIYEDRAGWLWIGTNDGGLNRFDPQTEQFTRYQHDPNDPYSLSGDNVWSIYEDRAGLLWIGTWGGGLNKFDPQTEQFAHYQHDPDDPHSLSDNTVFSIDEGRAGLLWIGTTDGLNKLERAAGQFSRYQHDPDDPHSLSYDNILSTCKSRSGLLWVGTWGGGLNKFDPQTEQFTRYQHDLNDPHSLSDDIVLSVYEDHAGLLWIGTYGGGLNKFDPQTEQFTRYQYDSDDPNGLSHNIVLSVYEDRAGLLWIGTWGGGLDRFDPQTEQFTHYQHEPDNPHSLSHNAITSIYEDRSGLLWIATNGGGLNKFDRDEGTFTHYREKDGLPSGVVYGILEDERGNLWLSTNKGLSKFNPRNETFKNYDLSDGLQGDEFNQGAYYKSESGEMFFGGINGFNAFYPQDIKDNPHVPPVVITGFRLFNEPVPIGGDSPLQKAIGETAALTLSHRDNVFSFEFAALSYAVPEKNRYAYKLEGFDKDWNYVDSKRRFATYTDLPAGDYVFRVKGSNEDGAWNEEGVALNITIIPPWWETLWFRGALVVLALGLAFAAYRWRVGAIEGQRRQLEIQVAERTEELAKRLQEQAALYAVTSAAVASLEPDEMLSAALDAVLPVLEADAGWVLLPGPDPPRIVARRGVPESLPLAEEKPSEALAEAGLHGHAGIPLSAGGRVLGVLHLAWRAPRSYTESERTLLMAVGQQVGLALHNAQLYQAARQVDRLRVLNNLDRELADTLNLEKVMGLALRQIAAALDAPAGKLFLLSPRADAFFERVFTLEQGRVEVTPHEGDEQRLRILSQRLQDGREPVLLSGGELGEAQRWGPSCLVVPIWSDGEPVAVLALGGWSAGRAFTDEDLALVQAAASRVGQATRSARLYEAEREQRKLVEQSQAQLVHSEKMAALGRLTASLAHEISNPLQVLRSGFRLLLNREITDEGKRRQYLQAANRQAERLINLVERTLDFYRPSSGQPESTNVNAVLDETLLLAGKKLEHSRVNVNRRFASGLPPVEAVADQLGQVFLNLILNAMQAMPEGGELTVETTRDDVAGEVRIAFTDTGVGIPDDEIPRLFEPFFTTRPEGSGLGLPISYGIVERHDGRIEVQSEVGAGSTFTVILPVEARR
jgi:signal transduction histidine kinase/ligand-binding sensor domain-containing protein